MRSVCAATLLHLWLVVPLALQQPSGGIFHLHLGGQARAACYRNLLAQCGYCASTSLPGSAATFATSAFCSVAANCCSDLAALASLMKNVAQETHHHPETTLIL